MPIATSDDQRAVAAAVRAWGTAVRPVSAARAQEHEPDRWRTHWQGLADLGTFAIAVPETAGGADGSIADLAVVLEQTADLLVPGPVLSTALAGLLLARSGAAIAEQVLPAIADGSLPVAVALRPGDLTASTDASTGALTLRGNIGPVLGADLHTAVVVSARTAGEEVWLFLDAGTPGLKLVEHEAGDFSRALATVQLDDVNVAPERVLAGLDSAVVLELAATLAAAEAAGIAGWALRTAVEYAKVREQFGQPIGAFQAIKHMCAEMLCRVEQATAVAWDAAQAADDDAQRPVAAAVAAAIALDAAVDTAKDCIQVLGGIGFTWEHDAHLYLRRALALRSLLGGTSAWRRRVTDLALAGSRRELRIDLDADADGLRNRVRASVEQIAARPADQHRVALAESGFLAPHWPAPHGRDATPVEQLVIDQELARAGVTRPDLVIAAWAVPTIVQYGTPEQIERFVGPTLRGEITWCQLFSEPGAGSDLAALRTKADRVDGGWALTGQKVWTSVAQRADWAICLARSDASAPKHRGISYFLVDMRSPGIEVRPLREITGEAVFNEVFLDEVLVPDAMLVGDLNDGWKLARATLVNERIAMGGGSSIGDAVERLLALAAERDVLGDDVVRDRLGGLVADGLAGSLLELRSTLHRMGGNDASAESSVRKLVGVRHRQAVAEAALDVLGVDGALDSEQLRHFLMTRCLTIAGGTTQVLLTLAGERILGLPRG
jgi:alkylation response protein AidB-like acyl-CoA dehydrogenase